MKTSFIAGLKLHAAFPDLKVDKIRDADPHRVIKAEILIRQFDLLKVTGNLKSMLPGLKKFEAVNNRVLQLISLYIKSYIMIYLTRFEEAEKILKTGFKILKHDPDLISLKLHLLNNKLFLVMSLGKYRQALDCIDKILQDSSPVKLKHFYYQSLTRKASVFRQIGKYRESKNIYQMILNNLDKSYFRERAIVFNNMGNLPTSVVSVEESLLYKEKACKLFKKIGERIGEAYLNMKLETRALEQNRFEEAINWNKKTQGILEDIHDKKFVLTNLFNLATIYLLLGNYKAALKICRYHSKKLARGMKFELFQIHIIEEFTKLQLAAGNYNPDKLFKIMKESLENQWHWTYYEYLLILLEYYYRIKDKIKFDKYYKQLPLNSHSDLKLFLLRCDLFKSFDQFPGELAQVYKNLENDSHEIFFHFCACRAFKHSQPERAEFHKSKFLEIKHDVLSKLKNKSNIKSFNNLWYVKQMKF